METGMPETLKAGIIGIGMISNNHADAYKANKISVVSLSDVDPVRLNHAAKKHNISSVTTDWRELIQNPQVNIVSICTPPKFHKEMAVAALRAGKHVICEKPLAMNLEEADEILEAEKQSKSKLTVVHQYRYKPVYQRMKWLFSSGSLGRPLVASCTRHDAPPDKLVTEKTWGQWSSSGGGVLMTKAIHQIDLLLWFFGKVKKVEGIMKTAFLPIESEDIAIATLEFESGLLLNLCVSGHFVYRESLECLLEHGAVNYPWRLMMKDKEAEMKLLSRMNEFYPLPHGHEKGFKGLAKRTLRTLLRKKTIIEEPLHNAFFKDFLQAVSTDAKIPVPAAEGRNSMEVCMAIYTSALTGQKITLPLSKTASFYKGILRENYDTRIPR